MTENIKMYKNPELKNEYQKMKYQKYNCNEKLKSWLHIKFYYCEICHLQLHYMSKYRHLEI